MVINESKRRTVGGITANPVETFGTLKTIINIKETGFIVKFGVVTADIRIPESAIIGREFIKKIIK